jgi:hypothetical protein
VKTKVLLGAICLLLIVSAIVGVLRHRNIARAETTPLPSVMEPLDAAQWDAWLMHLSVLRQQEKPYLEGLEKIAMKYSFKLEDLGRTVDVDQATGKITRRNLPRKDQ